MTHAVHKKTADGYNIHWRDSEPLDRVIIRNVASIWAKPEVAQLVHVWKHFSKKRWLTGVTGEYTIGLQCQHQVRNKDLIDAE